MLHPFIASSLYMKSRDLRPKSVYQILIGKRTPTSLFYAWENDLDPFFNSLANLSEADYDKWRRNCKVITPATEEEKLLLKAGMEGEGYLPPVSKERRRSALRLYLQLLSHVAYGQAEFSPLVFDVAVLNWLQDYLKLQAKRGYLHFPLHLPENRKQNSDWLLKIYAEWQAYLANVEPFLADLFLSQFGGYQLPPIIPSQIAMALHLDVQSIEWVFNGLYASCYEYFLKQTDSLTGEFLDGIRQMCPPWSPSANKTLLYYKQGYALEEIARLRQLKASTIADHYVDIYLRAPEIFLKEVCQSLKLRKEELEKISPPQDFAAFQALYDNKPFWQYRYWQCAYLAKRRQRAWIG